MSKKQQNDKEKILAAVQKMNDKATFDDVIERLFFLKKLERALEQADKGDVIDHDVFMDQLSNEYEERSPGLDRRSARRPATNRGQDRSRESKRRPPLHRAVEKVSR